MPNNKVLSFGGHALVWAGDWSEESARKAASSAKRAGYDYIEMLMIDPDSIPRLMQSGVIEVAPLAYMRGRTLNDAFVILDEAQNTTPEQMKMFLTRLGFGSKMVVTGDVTQVDLPNLQHSGLRVVRNILNDIDDIAFLELTAEDVVRHRLIGDIVKAYDAFDESKQVPRPIRNS